MGIADNLSSLELQNSSLSAHFSKTSSIIVLLGAVTGLVLSVMSVVLAELWRGSIKSAEHSFLRDQERKEVGTE